MIWDPEDDAALEALDRSISNSSREYDRATGKAPIPETVPSQRAERYQAVNPGPTLLQEPVEWGAGLWERTPNWVVVAILVTIVAALGFALGAAWVGK